MIRNHSAWLEISETVFLSIASTTQQRGRPRKLFQECSSRTKRRRLAEMSIYDESIATALRDTSVNSDKEDKKRGTISFC